MWLMDESPRRQLHGSLLCVQYVSKENFCVYVWALGCGCVRVRAEWWGRMYTPEIWRFSQKEGGGWRTKVWVRMSMKGGGGLQVSGEAWRGGGGARTSESLLNLIRIHPGRGAEEQCREATVIYKQQKQPGYSKMHESHSFCTTVIKGEFHLRLVCVFRMKGPYLDCYCTHLPCNCLYVL